MKSLKFLYDISLALSFEKCNLNTDKTNLWKAGSPVKTVSVLKKLIGLFVKIWSMQLGLFGFLEHKNQFVSICQWTWSPVFLYRLSPSFFSMSLITACLCEILNLFVPNTLFFYPLKTSEKLTVFWYFQWVEKGRIECVKILIKKAWIAISVGGVFSSSQKRFKDVNYFWKALDLRCLKGFWICLRYLIQLRNTTFILKRINITAVGKQRFLIPWQTPNMWHVFTFFFNHSYWKRYILGKFCYQNWLAFYDF